MKKSLLFLVLSGSVALFASCLSTWEPTREPTRWCYVGVMSRGYAVSDSQSSYRRLGQQGAAVGRLDEEQCSRVDAFVHSMRRSHIQQSACPVHTDAFLRTVEVRNRTHYRLRASVLGSNSPELVGPGIIRRDPLAVGRQQAVPSGSGHATYCVYVRPDGADINWESGTMLYLHAVERSSAAEGVYDHTMIGGSVVSYRFPITLGEGPQVITVEAEESEARLENDPRPALLRQVGTLSTRLATAERDIELLNVDLSASQEETAQERELRLIAEETIRRQVTLLRRMRRELRMSREETADLRRRLDDAETRMRSMVPRSVVEAVIAQRVGEAEYAWAMRTFSRSVARGASSSGFCQALLGAGVSALPGLLMTIIGGPEGFLASFALDVIAGIAGEALSFVASPIINAICR